MGTPRTRSLGAGPGTWLLAGQAPGRPSNARTGAASSYPPGALMGLGRRPREVYRTLSEEELLDGDAGLDRHPGEPPPELGGTDGFARIGPAGSLAARARAILVTVLATLLGLAVGLAAVTLIDGGGLPDVGGASEGAHQLGPAPAAGAAQPALPTSHGASSRERGGPRRAPRAPRVAVAAGRAPTTQAANTNSSVSTAVTIGNEQAPTGAAPTPPAPAAPEPAPAASGLPPVAREAGGEFGFER